MIVTTGGHNTRLRRLYLAATLVMIVALLSPSAKPPIAGAQSSPEGRFYGETGFTLAPQFVDYFDKHGGVPILGYPIGEAHQESGFLVQWTERQRLEYHPENRGTDYEVLLGLLGRELTRGLNGPGFRHAGSVGTNSSGSDPSAVQGDHYFKETGQTVNDLFYSYWLLNGGLPVFGYPISAPVADCAFGYPIGVASCRNGNPQLVQWFERARFEIHPENPPETRVLLGQLGNEALKARSLVDYTFRIDGNPAPEPPLQIGLAQGGESSDPAFFDNVQKAGQELGPGLVRLDNIFNFYNIVQRAPDGTISYNWQQLDQVLGGVRAMGKEPLICLSYMPETLSVTGASRVMPPASYDEWAALVKATVTHVNIDLHLGVRYWEIWNEPDQWSFWRAPFQDYLKLYDVTVDAALAADPTIKLGGPAVSYFSTDHLREFLEHERTQAECRASPQCATTPDPAGDSSHLGGRVDFISWHSYGVPADGIAANIRRARDILADFPQFSPQIFITEFNVLQGGPGDTSAGGYTDTAQGAIAFLSSIESMQRERLDRAFLFELKDGQGSSSYWGKWGILTYDGRPKPVYYAFKAYQGRPAGMLPAALTSGHADGTLGLMAYGSPARATIMLWYTGSLDARVKVALPTTFEGTTFDVALFDSFNNNPSRTGDSTLKLMPPRDAGDLMIDLKPTSLAIITSR